MDGGAPEARRGARAPARRLEGVSAAASVAGPCRDCLARELRQGRSDSVIRLLVKRLDPSVALPAYAHDGDAGLALPAAHDVTLEPNGRALVATGLAVAIPTGFAGLVLPRSGLARAQGVTVLNTPGLIDAGYRGELKILLVNHGEKTVTLRRGERVAQLVVQRVERAELVEVSELPPSERAAGGFGSTCASEARRIAPASPAGPRLTAPGATATSPRR